jgi:Flp pilus assembly protein TadG
MKQSRRFSFRLGRRETRPTSIRAGREEGSALIELAMALPLVAALLVGIIKAGTLFYDYVTLADAVAVGARALATSRGVSTACTNAEAVVTNAATNLVTSNITVTISFPSANDSCPGTLNPGDEANVQATYPCNLAIPFLGNLWPTCTLTSQTTVRIE